MKKTYAAILVTVMRVLCCTCALAKIGLPCAAITIGPGVNAPVGGGSVSPGDGGARLNIAGFGDHTSALLPGTYDILNFGFESGGASAGTVTPFLAKQSSSNPLAYETIWLGGAASGVGAIGSTINTNYAAGSQSFSLDNLTNVAAGFFTSEHPHLVRYVTPNNGGNTVHDATFLDPPQSVGDSIGLFSHPNLDRSYRFEINVQPQGGGGGGPIYVNNLTELRVAASLSNAQVIMAPGEYWVDKNGGDPTLVRLTGDNTTYDFSQATFIVDTRNFDGFGGGHENTVNVFGLYGAGSTLSGLDLEAVHVDLDTDPNAQRWADAPATNMIRISGSDNRLENSSIIARGSNTFGYGDAFGKGGSPCSGCANIGPRKGLGVQVLDATGTTEIDHLDLAMQAFGHGIYIQGTSGLVDIRNSKVIGELADSQDVIDHPVYQASITPEYPSGRTHYGPAMWEGIKISKSEDGIRTYDTASADLYIENTIVENMREAYSLFGTTGTATVINAEAWNNETGFEPGTGDIILNSRASATNGPVLYMRQNNINDTEIEIELHGDALQPGRDWSIAFISGNRNEVTLTNGGVTPGVLSANSLVRVSQNYNDWRHLPGLQDAPIGDGRTTRDLSIVNTSGQDLMLGNPSLESTSNYEITNGNVLGGSGTIFTAQTSSQVDIILMTGGALDPVGSLTFDVGAGDLELTPGINGTASEALRFQLEHPETSDTIRMATTSRLNIGAGALEFGDFLFSADEDFAGGTFTLFESTVDIFGTLGTNLTGTIAGLEATLAMSADGKSILLAVAAPPLLAGDYNADGVVDAADYTVWRDALNSMSPLLNETASLGVVDEDDYIAWKQNFGAVGGRGQLSLAVPEPGPTYLLSLAVFLVSGTMNRLLRLEPARR